MHIIVCVDDRGGMLFNNRRQSRDSAVRARILSGLNGKRLLMNSYSFGQFEREDSTERIIVDDDFLDVAESGDVCFVENIDLLSYSNKIETITVYKWNRTYPSSVKLPKELIDQRKLVSRSDFVGSSHEKITEEIYK